MIAGRTQVDPIRPQSSGDANADLPASRESDAAAGVAASPPDPGSAVGAAAAPAAPATAGQPLASAQTALHAPIAANGDWLGRVLDDRYRITERLGEGGMGAVFVAEHLKLHKAVALKVIRPELAGNGEVAARFAREAMATAQFEHPHVASAIDYGTLPEGGAYLVMQLVRGRSLRELLEARGSVPWPKACELLAQVADALSAARAAGVVHRDLKPDNILVETREDGSELVKILDFGIAHVAPHKTPAPEGAMPTRELTRVGTVMGTPGYMAPEQAVGDRVDHRTDLYALGVVLWECITGKCLWDGPDVTTIIARQMREEVPWLRATLADPSLPRELDALVQRLCARNADQRPDNAANVRDELRAMAARHAERNVSLARASLHSLQRGAMRWSALPARERGVVVAIGAVLCLGVLAFGASRDGSTSHGGLLGRALSSTADEHGKAEVAIAQDPPIPTELEPDIKLMLEASKAAERRRAAQSVLAFKDVAHLPQYVVAIAKLESARGCKDRKDAIRGISELADARALPPLQRLSAQGRSGCGFLGLEDCYGCVRADVRRAIDAMQPKSATTDTAAPH